jgi:G3E family GTPase
MMRLPATLISGYLGAGKTTLLNRLLTGTHGRRLAVLVNDFGAVNIDASLVVAHGDQTVSLSNGCICCAITDDLGAALQAQVDRLDRSDHLVIEASGAADAGRLAQLIGGWPGLTLDAVVTLASAPSLSARVHDRFVGSLVRRQLRAADLVALTGTDLCDPAQAREIAAAHALGAPVIDAPFGEIDPALLLGPAPGAIGSRAARADAATVPALPPSFHSATWSPRGPASPREMLALVDSLPEAIHRVKGFVRDDHGKTWLIQRVGMRSSLEPAPEPAPEPALVFIVAGPRAVLESAISRFETVT